MTTEAPTVGDRSDMGSTSTNETSALIASDRVEGTAVRRRNGDSLGRIERLMIEKRSGRVAYAVMSFGGFLGMGEGYHTIPWGALTFNPELDAYEVDISEEQLRNAPQRSAEGGDPSSDRAWEEHVHRYYNAHPYWTV
ncbi:hypothetical protein GMJLKIPL_2640 [Methylobacterium isbiliense]|jgi:hypothetical protein|uniref:PRC-barrel domain-containing protein n=2 Tax=Methylobacteriaceae TaxID=119045 RepID=A0ABQ4SG10_9HYPH|nr:hypothetical protein GMJLKIPL_2640 [Methylobacterium isbiliense]